MKWNFLEPPDSELVQKLSDALSVDRVIAALLVRRGISTFDEAKAFFRSEFEDLLDPMLMLNMEQAVSRIERALQSGEHITVYGDYDVDGTSSVALVTSFLKQYTDQITYYIPDRYKEGYGLSMVGIKHAKEIGSSLMIVLDCGIRAIEQTQYANDLGIDLIICDHHLPSENLPDAIILNPKQKNCPYPYKELCGCGIGFKLIQAFSDAQGNSQEALYDSLGLVALAIGADIVPITGENRTLAALGLDRIRTNPLPGMDAILRPANKLTNCSISDLVFTLAPRINAAGRLESGAQAVELLMSKNILEAQPLADAVTALNDERRSIEQDIAGEAVNLLPEQGLSHSSVLFKGSWHKGVIGIVASRVQEVAYKPTVILTESNGLGTGSVRSVKGFDVHSALESCSDLLIQFGGHQHAAGLTIALENIQAFREKFEEVVSHTILPEQLLRTLKIDAEIPFTTFLDGSSGMPKFFRIVDQFAPFGPGNMKPVFVSKNVYCIKPRVLKGEHLSFTATQNENERVRCIAFKQAHQAHLLTDPVDLAYTIERNEWNGIENLQLMVRSIQPASSL